mmetsp:Transcript_1356/g.3360  ORF Transcript_1356/g.3360 Transcript_1356/m.3360 type:complete len:91 (-) Transcript_1356:1142-1414(-)
MRERIFFWVIRCDQVIALDASYLLLTSVLAEVALYEEPPCPAYSSFELFLLASDTATSSTIGGSRRCFFCIVGYEMYNITNSCVGSAGVA